MLFKGISDKILTPSIKNCGSPPFDPQKRQFTGFIQWLNRIFNSVDRERLKLNGPDVTCAEWLLRNGAAVRFKGQPSLITDYNNLIQLEDAGETVNSRVEEIYAKDASLNGHGFDHLIGCNHVKKITFILCNQIDSYCLRKLTYVKGSLEYLEIKSCMNVTDKGLLSLRDLRVVPLMEAITIIVHTANGGICRPSIKWNFREKDLSEVARVLNNLERMWQPKV